MTSSLPYIVHQAIFQTENLMVTNKSANRKCFSWRTRAVIMTRSVESFNRETFLFSLITGQKKDKEKLRGKKKERFHNKKFDNKNTVLKLFSCFYRIR